MTVIGLTGGSGTGKTTALGVLADMGAAAIDCDVVYYELLAAGGAILDEINFRFPGVVIDGVLDRKALGKIVFQDAEALVDLNIITHKYVCQAVDERLEALVRGDDFDIPRPLLVVIEAIALIESGIAERCDTVIGILAPKAARIRRIAAREGVDLAYVTARIDSQKPDEFFREHCDDTLENDYNSPAEFAEECRRYFHQIIT